MVEGAVGESPLMLPLQPAATMARVPAQNISTVSSTARRGVEGDAANRMFQSVSAGKRPFQPHESGNISG
jgi:hypothetical protein